VEHYRNLWNSVHVIHDKEADGTTICNAQTCPKTSAGSYVVLIRPRAHSPSPKLTLAPYSNHSFTWLNSRLEPVEVPAHEYMTLMQRWITGKIDDANNFPTDPNGASFAHDPVITTTPLPNTSGDSDDWLGKRSGFPKQFLEVCKTIFRQMLRVYAHLYWAHFIDYYNLSLEKQLNSWFCHFVQTATMLEMLTKQELEPMQPLIDLWAANATFPPQSAAFGIANVRAGERLMQMAGVAS